MRTVINIGRFSVDYDLIARNIITPICLKKEKNWYILSGWNEGFREYRIFKKEKNNSLAKEMFSWVPLKDGAIKLKNNIPYYIEEFLYEIYNFEFSNSSEKKDISLSSFINLSKNMAVCERAKALLLTVKMESKLNKKLYLHGPSGLYCDYSIYDDSDNSVTKMFRLHFDEVSYCVGSKEVENDNSIHAINRGNLIFEKIENSELILKSLSN